MADNVINLETYRAKARADKSGKEPVPGERNEPYTDDEAWALLSGIAPGISHTDESGGSSDDELSMDYYEEDSWRIEPAVYRLHLELIPEDVDGKRCSTADFFGDTPDREEFLKLSKAESSISRDILVPADMDLHALHYVIQQAFGWQNCHLHSFRLLEDDLNRLTAGRIGGYMDLCGILFRGSDDNTDDLCWDNDYNEGEDFRRWLKRKYRRPFAQYAVSDTRYACKRFVEWFKLKHPDISRDMKIRLSGTYLCLDLIEGLTMDEIFTTNPCREWSSDLLKDWKEIAVGTDEAIQALFEMVAQEVLKTSEENEVTREELNARIDDTLDALQKCRRNIRTIMRGITDDELTGSNRNYKNIKEATGLEPAEALVMYRSYGNSLIRNCHPLFAERAQVMPFAEEVLYRYDFGDNWWVRISCTDVYYDSDQISDYLDDDDFDNDEIWDDERSDDDSGEDDLPCDGESTGGEHGEVSEGTGKESNKPLRSFASFTDKNITADLDAMLMGIYRRGKPVCVAADGLNVMDDAGGIGGYYEFLKTINGKDARAKAESKAWAREQGWTGRIRKPENIL